MVRRRSRRNYRRNSFPSSSHMDDATSTTSLLEPAKNGNIGLARTLLEHHGANVNVRDDFNMTPLHHACEKGYFTMVRYFLDHGAEIEAVDDDGMRPLHVACKLNRLKVVRLLLDRGADIEAAQENQTKMTPLHIACNNTEDITRYHPNLAVAALLLDRGANIEAKCDIGWTPLHYSSAKGDAIIATMLLKKAAIVNAKSHHLSERTTPLHIACKRGKLEVVRLLLDWNADIAAKDGSSCTPLHEACRWFFPDVAHLLLSRGVNKEATDDDDKTPLHVACFRGRLGTVRILLNRGANIEATTQCTG
mmetsp:Transcript_46054/g.111541  ORF Transcript_46054/g.111541 Transcript_46054/m.111541 type:complete len:306 (-) Transcript_46054:129-1046(-)